LFNIGMETEKFGQVANVIDAVCVTIKTDAHVNDLIKSANTIITAEFVTHMSNEALNHPLKFGHMYDWAGIGNPGERLWRHVLRGRGASRQMSFDFKASTKMVPVDPILSSVGVKRNHQFTWKAPVIELGKPVSISPKLAAMLVFVAKDVKRGANTTGSGFQHDGRVYFNGTINIAKAGPAEAWGSFTNEFNTWFRSAIPGELIKTKLEPAIGRVVKNTVLNRLKAISSLKTKPKTITLEPVGVDKNVAATLAKSLHTSYIAAAATRRALVNDDIQ
jgi:hypothetical protein